MKGGGGQKRKKGICVVDYLHYFFQPKHFNIGYPVERFDSHERTNTFSIRLHILSWFTPSLEEEHADFLNFFE